VMGEYAPGRQCGVDSHNNSSIVIDKTAIRTSDMGAVTDREVPLPDTAQLNWHSIAI